MAQKRKNSPSQDRIESQGSDSDNRIQEAYDNIYNRRSSEGTGGNNDDGTSLYDKEVNPDKDESAPLDSEQQAKADNKTGGKETDNLYQPGGGDGGNRSFKATVQGAFSGRKKYGWIGGGILGTLISAIIFLFPTLGPLHIFSNFTDHNFGFNDSYRRNRTSRIVRSILSNNNTTRNIKDTPFKLKADLVDFEKFETKMRGSGWSFEYNADGTKVVGLSDPDGNRINLDRESGISQREFNRRVKPLIDDTIPAYRMNKRARTRALISTFTGPRRGFSWTNLFKRNRTQQPDFETAKYLKETGLDEAPTRTNDSYRKQATDQDGNLVYDENGNPVYEDAGNEGGVIDEARDEVVERKAAGASDADALDAGKNRIAQTLRNNPEAVTLVGVIVNCIAYQVYEQDLIGKFERYTSAMRIGSTFLLAVNEMQQGGDIEAEEVGQLFEEYNNEEGSFAESAAWQRATGQEVVGPELDPELHVIEQDGTQSPIQSIFEGIGAVFASIGLPGFDALCSFLGSTAGLIFGYILDIAEVVVGCIFSGCVAAVAKFAAVEAMFEIMGRLLAASLTNFVGFLTENPVQSAAFLDQTLNLVSSEENRSGMPVDSDEYNQQVAQFKLERNQKLPFQERYFSMDNPQSLTRKLAAFKASLMQSNPSQLIASLFSMPLKSLVAVANSGNVYAQTDIEFDNYDFQKYSFNNPYIDSDPFDLAEEVSDMIEADTEIVTSADQIDSSGNLARDFAVLCMGYDPRIELVNKQTNTVMLPMFSDPEVLGEAETRRRNNLYDALCLQAANSEQHTDTYTKVGRFVDDIELVSSIIELTGETVPAANSPSSGGGGGGTQPPSSEPPTAPPVCDPNDPSGAPCIN